MHTPFFGKNVSVPDEKEKGMKQQVKYEMFKQSLNGRIKQRREGVGFSLTSENETGNIKWLPTLS